MPSNSQIPDANSTTMNARGRSTKSAVVPLAAPMAMPPPEPVVGVTAARYM